jgi:porin
MPVELVPRPTTARRLAQTGLVGLLALDALVGPGPAAAAWDAAPLLRHLRDSPQLLGDPGGARGELGRLGIDLQLFYNQFLGWKPRGGARPDSTSAHSGSYDLFAQADLEELAGWRGGLFLLHVKGLYGRNVNPDVRALSEPVDDADFDEPIYVDELWLQQRLWGDRVAIRLGMLEQQTLYDRNAFANSEDRQFSATFLDNNPLVPLPNALGAAALLAPTDWLELAVGVADADNLTRRTGWDTAFDGADSLNFYTELKARVGVRDAARPPGSYRVGFFVDGRPRQVFGQTDPATGLPRRERGHLGAYLSFDQVALREAAGGEQGLGLFARFGYTDPDSSRIAWFWSAGLQYRGLLPGRDADVLGAGVYQALGSDVYRRSVDPGFDSETGLEIYYRVEALPWLAVTPDFQYIADPGASGAPDAVVVLLRLRVTF